ncbi:MAG: amidohydrolase family protein [Bacillota bacterium]|nr:amidohydrolase family protein [Bacillota bacterium]
MDFDFIIKGGWVIDGTGAPRVKADVGIKGDTIEAVGDLSAAAAAHTVDAVDQAVTPGFIDMHSHSDQTIAFYPHGESSLGQGITTSVGGQCSFSPAPLNRHWTACFWEGNWWDRVEPRKYYQEVVGDLDRARKAAMEVDNLDISWKTFGEWLDRVEREKPGLNFVPLIGHGAVRTAVMGQDYWRHATPEEVERMKALVEQALDEGAAGISNGMDYAPNCFCAPEESYELMGVVAKRGRYLSTHSRRTGHRQGFGNPGLIDGLREAIDIAQRTGIRLEIAHLYPGYLTVPSSTPKIARVTAEETLELVDGAIKNGVDLAFDVIPNHNAGGVSFNKYLAAALTPWFKQAGTFEQLAQNLRAPDFRQEIKDYIMAGRWFNLNPITSPNWAGNLRIAKSRVDEFVGRSIAEIAGVRKLHPLDALMDVLVTDPYAQTGSKWSDKDEIRDVYYKHPLAMVAIDTFLVDPTYEIRIPPYTLPNPNTFGGMARYIRLYANQLLGLEEGIRRITSLAASRLDLPDRGQIKPGKKADIVVFRPEAVTEKFDGEEPRQYPEGFSWVFVNGTAAMADGNLTLSSSGRVLRK